MDESVMRRLAAAAVLVLAVAAYANTFRGDWVWDDVSSVLLHKHVQDPAKFTQLFKEDQHAFGRGQGNFYRPLLAASFMLDYALSGGPTPGQIEQSGNAQPQVPTLLFHLTSLAWHALAAMLLLFLLLRAKAPVGVAAAAAALYAVHPLHTEAVAYISGRADMMSAAFMYAALLLALGLTGARRGILGGLLCLLCFCGGLLSKEATLIFPVMLGLMLGLQWLQNPREEGSQGRLALRHFWPLGGAVVVLAGYMVLRATVLKFAEAGDAAAAPLGQRLVESGQAFALYVKLLFWPVHLHMERTLEGAPGWLGLLGWVLILALAAGAAVAAQYRQYRITAGLVWFLAGWLPISGIFPLNAPMAEHWMYLPMAGFWWAAAETVALAMPKSMRLAPAIPTAAFCCMLLFMTIQRNEDWRDNVRLFRATLRENPGSVRVHYNLAVTYEDIEKNWAGARRHYEAVLRLQGQDGSVLLKAGTRVSVPEAEARLALARVLEAQMDINGALAQYQQVTKMSGKADADAVKEALFGGVRCLLAMGEWPTAEDLRKRIAAKDESMARALEPLLGGAPLREDF